jgi:hypothetical protein
MLINIEVCDATLHNFADVASILVRHHITASIRCLLLIIPRHTLAPLLLHSGSPLCGRLRIIRHANLVNLLPVTARWSITVT